MITVTASAILLAVVTTLGPQTAGLLLGFIALAGLASHATGFEPPRIVVLGWWCVLVFYVLLSFLTLVGAIAAA